MRRILRWAPLTMLVLLTACSRTPAPTTVSTPVTPPQPSVTSPASPTETAPTATAPASPAKAPVQTLRRAFALVQQTKEAQEIKKRLGTRMVMVQIRNPAEEYSIGVGENFPERVRFEMYFTVSRADGTVRYTDVQTGEEKLATFPPPDPAAGQAEALLAKGDIGAAIHVLTKSTAPTADTWNLLSYAHLLRGEWQAAADAGEEALKLDDSHPYALYNTGMAKVELKQYGAAISYLRADTEEQPDRAEPCLGLARAYQETGRHALAADAVAAALKLAPGDANAKQRQAAVDALISHTLPADAATPLLQDGPYAIYLLPGKPSYIYLKGPDGITGLPVGDLPKTDLTAVVRVDLPGGAVGYFLRGEPFGAYVSGSLQWRLFVRQPDGQFRQVLFLNPTGRLVNGETFPGQPVDDWLRAGGVPRVEGDRFTATYGDDASGKSTVKATWQFLPQEAKAVLADKVRENVDPNK